MGEQYGADQIQILEGLEAVRKRPGMYIGSTSARGLHHLVYEIVDNAVDEALAGYCDSIDVTINEDNSITVVDDGRGIPVDIQKKAGLPAVEVVFTSMQAVSSATADIRCPAVFMALVLPLSMLCLNGWRCRYIKMEIFTSSVTRGER